MLQDHLLAVGIIHPCVIHPFIDELIQHDLLTMPQRKDEQNG